MTTESITLTGDRDGAHVHIVVRAGVEGQRALCGNLTMRVHEWEVLRSVLAPGVPGDRIVISAAGGGAETLLRQYVAATKAVNAPGSYHGVGSVFSPTPEIIEYAIGHAEKRPRDPNARHLDIKIDDHEITVYDIPADRMAAVPPAPLPKCHSCGSTASPAECPCGYRTPAPRTSLSAPVDEEMPF